MTPAKTKIKAATEPTTATAAPAAKPGRKSRRHRSRELTVQGLYQWRVAGGSAAAIEAQLRETKEFAKTDEEYFSGLLRGVLANAEKLEKHIQPCIDRSFAGLSPVEAAILLLGAHELASCPEIPYRVVINESVELAKTFGGTDGHKYVNGVLDKLAAKLRAVEIKKK
jgi:N utilization substance protein B